MAGEWQTLSLADVYDFSSGLSKPRSEFGSGHPFLSFKDVFYNSAVPKQLTDLVQSTERERARCSVRRGDVFLTRTSETMDELGMSSVALADIPDATFNGFTKRLRPKRKLIAPGFARYFFRSSVFRAAVNSMATMSTRASLNNEMLERLTIAFPGYPEQEAIAHILGTLDDKIELNRRRNQTLEAMARALFKDWFVDFGPVRAKMGGQEPYLPADLWQLFPDRLDDEGKPEGWRRSTIGGEGTVCGGSTPSTKEPAFWEGGEHHWATPKDLSALTFPVLLDTDRKITDAALAKISSGLLPVGTVLLSSRAPIGYLAIAEVPTAINQGFIAMKCNGALPNVFVLFWCRENMDVILGNANGSTFQEISKSNFRPIPVIVPPELILNAFRERTGPVYRHIVENERESRSLAQLRDTLLPKLISGELRIKDAEKFLEDVA
ncbi:MAG: restriction endonuclease subunit S [Chromatiaceae bacterium]|nr:restriction endonuclease subunit S [Chromatiaceae bacterium]